MPAYASVFAKFSYVGHTLAKSSRCDSAITDMAFYMTFSHHRAPMQRLWRSLRSLSALIIIAYTTIIIIIITTIIIVIVSFYGCRNAQQNKPVNPLTTRSSAVAQRPLDVSCH